MAARNIRRIIACAKAPNAIGSYSQGVAVGDTYYLAGQVGLVPETMKLVSDDVAEQTNQVLKNIGNILESQGMNFTNVVKCTVLLASMDDYKTVNSVYAKYFTQKCPARAAYAVAGLPLNARVEIECIALNEGARQKTFTWIINALHDLFGKTSLLIEIKMTLPISPAVVVGDLMFVSGQLGLENGKLVPGGIESETRKTLDNIGEILKSQGLSFDKVIKCTVFLTDLGDFQTMNKVYAEYFPKNFPTRAAFQVAGLALNAKVEIECIATFSHVVFPKSKL